MYDAWSPSGQDFAFCSGIYCGLYTSESFFKFIFFPDIPSLCFSPLSLVLCDCLQHYANTFKGQLLLCKVILQWSFTPLMYLRGLRFPSNRSISGMTQAPRLNQGHTQGAHTHTQTHTCIHLHAGARSRLTLLYKHRQYFAISSSQCELIMQNLCRS